MKRSIHKHFYTHLISLEPITIALNEMPMTNEERWELITIAESHVHITIIDVVLSDLSTEDKKKFLEHMDHHDHTTTWNFLQEKTKDVEKKIKKASENVIKELLDDITDKKTS